MPSWAVAVLLTGASLGMIFFAYAVCATILRNEAVLSRWAKENSFRIIRRQALGGFQRPHVLFPAYHVTIEDQQKRRRSGCVRLGFWYLVGFKELIYVRWED